MRSDQYPWDNTLDVSKKTPRYRLTDVVVDEISVVSVPANQHASIVLMKSAGPLESGVIAKARALASEAARKSFRVCSDCPDHSACRGDVSCATESRTALAPKTLVETAKAVAAAHARRRR